MTERTWPLATQTDSAQVSEAEWSRYHSQVARSGVFGSPGDTSLKVTTDPTGVRQLVVFPGQATVLGYSYSSDANINLTLAANNVGSTRYDVVVLRYDSSATPAQRVSVKVVQGTAGSGVPAVTRTGTPTTGVYEVKLCTVTVPVNAGVLTFSSLSDDREFVGMDVIPFPDSAHVDAARLRSGQMFTVGGAVPQAYISSNGQAYPVTPVSQPPQKYSRLINEAINPGVNNFTIGDLVVRNGGRPVAVFITAVVEFLYTNGSAQMLAEGTFQGFTFDAAPGAASTSEDNVQWATMLSMGYVQPVDGSYTFGVKITATTNSTMKLIRAAVMTIPS